MPGLQPVSEVPGEFLRRGRAGDDGPAHLFAEYIVPTKPRVVPFYSKVARLALNDRIEELTELLFGADDFAALCWVKRFLLREDFDDPVPAPTAAPPGSHAKINELGRRFRRGLSLFHKHDAPRPDPVVAKEARRPVRRKPLCRPRPGTTLTVPSADARSPSGRGRGHGR
jgi:hypothetical protein